MNALRYALLSGLAAAGHLAAAINLQPSSLPPAVVGQAYHQALQAVGGAAPYIYQVTDGALPAGLLLDFSTGVISGMPGGFATGTFTVTATDAANQTGSAAYAIVIDLPQVSSLSFSVAGNAAAGQQPKVGLQLSNPYPVVLNGTLFLDFFADPSLNLQDDLSIQFKPQGRQIPFTIPAGSLQAVFNAGDGTFQSGTSAGDIFLSVALGVGGLDVTPVPTPFRLVHIDRVAPVLTGVSAARSANGFDVTISGFSTARQLSSIHVHMTAANGYSLAASPDVTLDVSSAASAYYARTDTAQFGSQFTVTIPFSLSNGGGGISSVTVTLTNSLGDSNTMSSDVQ